MNIKPVASPHQVLPNQSNPGAAREAKAKAIAAFNQGQTEQPVVANQNQIQPEELGAIKTKPQVEQNLGQSDTTTEAIEQKPEQDPQISRQFAQLARQTQQLRIERQRLSQEMKAKEADIQAREQALAKTQEPDLSQYVSRARLKQDTMAVLAEEQLLDTLAEQVMNPQPPTDPRVQATIGKLEAEIKAMRAERDLEKQSQTDTQKQQYQTAVKQIENDVRRMVESDPEFETVKAAKAYKAVVKLIEDTYAKDGVLMSNEEAAKEVEEELISRALAYDNIKKIQTRREQARSASKPQPSQAVVPQQKQMKTLTNATASSRQLSAKERAIMRFKGETF